MESSRRTFGVDQQHMTLGRTYRRQRAMMSGLHGESRVGPLARDMQLHAQDRSTRLSLRTPQKHRANRLGRGSVTLGVERKRARGTRPTHPPDHGNRSEATGGTCSRHRQLDSVPTPLWLWNSHPRQIAYGDGCGIDQQSHTTHSGPWPTHTPNRRDGSVHCRFRSSLSTSHTPTPRPCIRQWSISEIFHVSSSRTNEHGRKRSPHVTCMPPYAIWGGPDQ